MERIQLSVFVPIISHSRSLLPSWTVCALTVTAKGADCAKAKAGSKSSVAVWYTPKFCPIAALTRKFTVVLHLEWGWNALSCEMCIRDRYGITSEDLEARMPRTICLPSFESISEYALTHALSLIHICHGIGCLRETTPTHGLF